MSITAAYYPDPETGTHDVGARVVQKARAVEIWVALRSLGSRGVEDLIERTCRHATVFADGLREAGFKVLKY
jgi:glutamate/tyrosine decarboxylase-like PLP-dependent enzyme